MPLKVLVVDDSQFFQLRLKEIINQHPDLQVVGIARDGEEAVRKAVELQPDVITMDFEMPVMDGVTAVRQIMSVRAVPILMFSSLTYEGARVTLDALAAGAMDFMAKDFAEVSRNSAALSKALHERLLLIGRKGHGLSEKKERSESPALAPSPQSSGVATADAPVRLPKASAPEPGCLQRRLSLLIIGASTGGPVALTEVLTKLPQNFPLPIVLVQHMPENFTKAFAERLDRQCQIEVREAQDGDKLQRGFALLAPGGKQLMIERNRVRVLPDDVRLNYKPSLDITFGSAANSFGNRVLGIVLTGMGSDGCKGAELLKRAGSIIWSQDEATSVIYGMPMAVAKAQLTDKVLALQDVGLHLTCEVM